MGDDGPGRARVAAEGEGLVEPRLKGAVNPDRPLSLVHLRASQINGCAPCVFASAAGARRAGETDERPHNVVAWRGTAFFTDRERAALALTGAATRLRDGAPGVTDDIWDAAAGHFTGEQLNAIVLEIAMTNFFDRINHTTREQAGKTW
jgi:AhpD family alkylhydroperoxidase